jgi:hypothetical protein
VKLCPRAGFDTKATAENALAAAIEKLKTTGNMSMLGQLKVYSCRQCQYWHIHPMRRIDPNYRRPAENNHTNPVETCNINTNPTTT